MISLKLMLKPVATFFLLLVLASSAVTPINAGIVTISKDGGTTVNVLAETTDSQLEIDKPESLDVNKIADTSPTKSTVISLNKNNNKVNLNVSSESGNKDLDVSDWKGDIVEIEERPQTRKLAIYHENGKFKLKQRGVSASTDKALLIDSKLAEISVKTETGNKFLAVLPYDAVQTLLKTKVVNEVSQDNLDIVEENGSLSYKIEGNKVINFFNVYSYRIPVSSFISATSGEILKVDSPTIYKYVTFLFV